MLCITMRRGEYFTVDGDTVILVDQLSGERAHLTIHAPRDVAIVRGAVLERNGNPPPEDSFSRFLDRAEVLVL